MYYIYVIISIRETELIHFEKIRKPFHYNEPFVARCKIGWTVFGPNPIWKINPLLDVILFLFRMNIIKKLDVLLYESFAERPHDFNHALSVNDKIVLEKYKKIYKTTIDDRYQI